MNDTKEEKLIKIVIGNKDDPEMNYLMCQLKEIFSSLPASTMCDVDFVIAQLRKKLFTLNPMVLQSLDCESKKSIKECLDSTLEYTRKVVDGYLNDGFESVKQQIFRKLETNYFMDDGKDRTMH